MKEYTDRDSLLKVNDLTIHYVTESGTVHAVEGLNLELGVGETLGLDVREYSKEELIAEIGAAVLVHHVGLETDRSFRNSTAYLQNWLSVLRNDKRFIVSASGKAEKAVEMILN